MLLDFLFIQGWHNLATINKAIEKLRILKAEKEETEIVKDYYSMAQPPTKMETSTKKSGENLRFEKATMKEQEKNFKV